MKERIARTTKRLILALMMAVVIFAAMPIAGFETEAAPAKPGKIYTIKAKNITSETATIKWSKASGKVSGYSIYRNGKYLAYVNASTFSYKEKHLKYSTKYTYYVRAYYLTGGKVKKYYNKKTEKWQTTLPAKKYRGEARWINRKVYGEKSPILSIKTMAPTVIHGKKITPSMCPTTFIKDGTKCKICGKGKTIKVTYKNGAYNITITGTDRSKKCNHK